MTVSSTQGNVGRSGLLGESPCRELSVLVGSIAHARDPDSPAAILLLLLSATPNVVLALKDD